MRFDKLKCINAENIYLKKVLTDPKLLNSSVIKDKYVGQIK